MSRRARERGMTLIEVMVALALLALLSVGIVSAFRLGEHSFRQLTRVDSSSRDIAIAQRELRRLLESVYPFEPDGAAEPPELGFEGTSDRIEFTAPMSISAGAAGHRRFEVLVKRVSDGSSNLIVRSSADINSATAPAREEVLLERIESVQWAYLEPIDAMQAQTQMQFEPAWLHDWTAMRRPPRLVRLRISFAPGDKRIWPELIVDPRITDDANCEFDVVAQACREGQS